MEPPRVEPGIAWDGRGLTATGAVLRHFVGIHRCPFGQQIQGALVRVMGRGLTVSADVVATAAWQAARTEETDDVDRSRTLRTNATATATDPADAAQAAAGVATSLASNLRDDRQRITAIGLQGFGDWREDLLHGRRFIPNCDTAFLAQLTGLTVVDDFPGRDLAEDGRGGPCEAAGLWLLLADRGMIPGRRIRALLDLNDTVRLVLLPPRQTGQLSPHLMAFDVAPGWDWLGKLEQRLLGDRQATDPQGKLAVQGRTRELLLQQWSQTLPSLPVPWQPEGYFLEPLWQALENHWQPEDASLHDILCTAVHLIAQRVVRQIKEHLPRSQPVGQLLLTGPGQRHGFLVGEIRRQLPEVEVTTLNELGIPSASTWAAATALMAQLTVDQIPGNSPSLTGAQVPRVLGRLTPGGPVSWHQVLADMALTLPDKLPLRHAV